MVTRYRAIALTMTILILAGACGSLQPTDAPLAVVPTRTAASPTCTSEPPTKPMVPPTSTPVRPAATTTLRPTPTRIPATATPTLTSTSIAESRSEGVRVTFVFNAGFLITAGDKRILVDVLYEGYPGGILKPVLDSQPPSDGVDLILATHEHQDHFSPALVLSYMQDNPQAVFVSTRSAVEQLVALDRSIRDRAIPLEIERGESEQIDLDGLALEAIHLSHGIPDFLNLGFVIQVGDVRLFHTGDVDPSSVSVSALQCYGLPEGQIDVALVPYFLLTMEEYHAHATEGIQARYLIPMHLNVDGRSVVSATDFPNVHVFEEAYESWVVPATDRTAPAATSAPQAIVTQARATDGSVMGTVPGGHPRW